jgi:hypothetical protein
LNIIQRYEINIKITKHFLKVFIVMSNTLWQWQAGFGNASYLRTNKLGFGMNTVNYGPTFNNNPPPSTFTNSITPVPGKFVFTDWQSSGYPIIYAPKDATELVSISNFLLAKYSSLPCTNQNDCIEFLWSNENIAITNRQYENIYTTGLTYNYDFGWVPCYPRQGTLVASAGYANTGSIGNGTLTNGPTYDETAQLGGFLQFDGTNDYVNLPSQDIFTNNSFTIELWMFPRDNSSNYVIFSAYGPGPNYNNRAIHVRLYTTGVIRFAFYNDDLDSSSGAYSYLAWQQLTLTYNASTDTSTIYVNGTSVATGSQGPFIETSAITVRLGNWFSQEYYYGNVGSCRVWSGVALTSTQITANYNAQKARYGL